MTIFRTLAASALLASTIASPVLAAAPPSAAAVVDADGTLARGIGATGASRVGTGSYTVTFTNASLSTSCAYVASIGLSATSGISDPGTVSVAAVSGDTVSVLTYDQHAEPADRGFHVYVAC